MCGDLKQKTMNLEAEFLCKIDSCIKAFDEIESKMKEIDNYIASFNQMQSDCDKMLSDCYHLLEDYEISDVSKCNIANKIGATAEKRRNIKRMIAIGLVWSRNNNRIDVKGNRVMLEQKIKNCLDGMNSTQYKERVMTEEEKNLLLSMEDKPKTKQVVKIDNSIDKYKRNRITREEVAKIKPIVLEALRDNKESIADIGKRYGIKRATIYLWKREV